MRKHGSILILFILVLSFVLAGCGGEEPAAGQITPNTTGAAVVETTAPLEEAPASLGRLEGGTYTNTYAGYGCELDANWVYYSAEELQALPENINELLADTDLLTRERFAELCAVHPMRRTGAMGTRAKRFCHEAGYVPDYTYGVVDKCLLSAMTGEDTLILTCGGMLDRVELRARMFAEESGVVVPVVRL